MKYEPSAISLLKGKQARSTMAAYPKYNARVLLSIGCDAGDSWTDLLLNVQLCPVSGASCSVFPGCPNWMEEVRM